MKPAGRAFVKTPDFNKKILVVDDESAILQTLRFNLERSGYAVVTASDGRNAIAMAQREQPDLIVLDIMLPVLDGIEACKEIRNFSSVPIIMLTAKDQEIDKVLALELGADDYVTKPFGMEELLARMRAAMRHQLQVHGERPIFKLGELSVDLVHRIVKIRNKEVKLSPKEYELLRLLVHHAGKVLTHKFLLNELWSTPIDAQYLRVYVRQLRSKIEPDPARPHYILTETGIGYRLRMPE